MKIVFVTAVPGQGKAGDIKDVANGYARNYLLPKGLALPATSAAMTLAESRRKKEAVQEARERKAMEGVAEKLEGMTITMGARAGEQERLYGSITSAQIAEEIGRQGVEIDKRRIDMNEPIHQLGEYEIAVKLGGDLAPKIKVIVQEND
jgi:large subunit ribosomal protein L9